MLPKWAQTRNGESTGHHCHDYVGIALPFCLLGCTWRFQAQINIIITRAPCHTTSCRDSHWHENKFNDRRSNIKRETWATCVVNNEMEATGWVMRNRSWLSCTSTVHVPECGWSFGDGMLLCYHLPCQRGMQAKSNPVLFYFQAQQSCLSRATHLQTTTHHFQNTSREAVTDHYQ